ncbi:MAG TPA: glycosyltransferase family 39 protein [Gaiellaceae bacterium]|nr:glycosyltransferase family 39 protein [Gaiellaceae bacterium]
MRILSARRSALVVAGAAILPRLVVLLAERGSILTAFTEKSDDFARTFVLSGTYGFVPGVPSANTQPLYGWFLIPLYRLFGRHWVVVGTAQIVVAVLTALVVLAIGRTHLSHRAGLLAALAATLNPYLIWHDVHVNREILDQLAAAGLFLLVLLVARAGTIALAAAAGVAAGVAILGNSRLAALPLVLAVYLAWRQRSRLLPVAAALLVAAAVTIAPWVIRNRVQVGCFAITTDARALWKANNEHTYSTLAAGKWIDDVPPLPGAPHLTPEFERDIYAQSGRVVRVDECAQMDLYEHATFRFWRHHPGEKAKLMVQATGMLWQPEQTRTEGGPSSSTAKAWSEALWAIPMYVLALVGLFLVPAPFAALALVFLVYNTAAAWLFAGATRYRVSFDFVLALLAAAAFDRLLSRWRYTASIPSAAADSENDSSARALAADP